MRLAEAFPRWQASSNCVAIPWQRQIDLRDDATFSSLLALVLSDQNLTVALGSAAYERLSEAILEDIWQLQANRMEGCDVTNLLYLQFEVALAPFRSAINRGEFGLAHDWIANGLGEHLGHEVEREVHAGRLQAFMDSETRWIVANRGRTITEWSFAFYYYCRRRAAFFEVAVAVLPAALTAIDELPPIDDSAIDARGMIANWAATYNLPTARSLVQAVRLMFDAPGVSLHARVNIAVLFSSAVGLLTDRPPRAWAAWALQHGGPLLDTHQPFQLLWTLVETLEDWERLKSAIFSATELYAATINTIESPVIKAQAIDLRSGLLNPAFVILHRLEQANGFCAVLQRWYEVPAEQRLAGNVLFISPNHQGGTAFLGARSQLISRSEDESLGAIIETTNKALGLTLTLEGDSNLVNLADRLAQPDYSEAQRFEAVLRKIYPFEQIEDETIKEARAIAAFPGYPHPLQALMLATREGVTFPITSSLQEPEQDRPIRRALLWDSESDLYSTFEVGAIEELLGAAGVECVRVNGRDRSIEEFLLAYSDPTYDVVWIAGHGEIDHWRDGSFELLIGAGSTVGIEPLMARTPKVVGRRLLVLNVCDGGVAAVNGGIHRLGLAPMLASAQQAGISHFWPVAPLVAGAFGVFLAAGVAQGLGHFASFARALEEIRNPFEEMRDAVRALVPHQPLVERLENADIDTSNIFHWGSPCFYQ